VTYLLPRWLFNVIFAYTCIEYVETTLLSFSRNAFWLCEQSLLSAICFFHMCTELFEYNTDRWLNGCNEMLWLVLQMVLVGVLQLFSLVHFWQVHPLPDLYLILDSCENALVFVTSVIKTNAWSIIFYFISTKWVKIRQLCSKSDSCRSISNVWFPCCAVMLCDVVPIQTYNRAAQMRQ